MDLRKLLSVKYWIPRYLQYKKEFEYDIQQYITWGNKDYISRKELKTPEWKYLRCFRKAKANHDNIWGKLYGIKLERITLKTGIWIPTSIKCGHGITIGHWGRIIVNPNTEIGDEFSISNGAVIGRDVRGKRKGYPKLGNRVCLKANAVVVGAVNIGDDVLIAPNAFVNFDVPSHSVVVGNPGVIHHKEDATKDHIGYIYCE